MSAVIVKHLEHLAMLERKKGSVAYFFFDKSDESKNTSLSMYRTLVYQLFSRTLPSSTKIETAFQTAKLYGRSRFSSADGPVPLLRGIFKELKATTYIIVDALDECQDIEEALGPFVDAIQHSRACRALFLSRDIPPVREAISGCQSMRMAPESTKPDVDMYLASALQHLTVPITDTALRQEVFSRLSRGADGMFLWARLMVQQLNTATSPADVLDMITGPPTGLHALYHHVLQGLDSEPKQWRDLKSNIISRVLCSPRPLSWIELQTSLSLVIREEENLPLDRDRRRPYQSLVLKLCQPFVEYHTETDCFRPAHLSVIQFMSRQNEPEDAVGIRLDLSNEHQKISKLCLNYLNVDGVHSVVSVDADKHPLARYATAYWCHHLVNAEPDVELGIKATKFLASDEKRQIWLTRILLRDGELLSLERVFLLVRQARSWLKDAMSGSSQSPCIFDVLGDIVEILISLDQRWLETRQLSPEQMKRKSEKVIHISTFDKSMALQALVREYILTGRHDEAVATFRAARVRLEKTVGVQPGDVAWLLDGIGLVLEQQKKTELAIATQKEALDIQLAATAQNTQCQTGPGPNHALDSLHTMDELGRLYRHLGQLSESEAMHKRALEGLRAAGLPSTDLKVIWTVNSLGRCLRKAGRPREAMKLHAEALEARAATLGPAHPLTLWSMRDLAKCHRDAGEFAIARELFERHLRGREQELGPLHFDTLWSMGELALTLEAAGDWREALAWHERALEGRNQTLGESHPATVWSRDATESLRSRI